MTTFADLGLSAPLLEALHDVGYESPSPIQEQAIPPLLEGRDVIGQAQTGSGKTAAFGLPLIQYVDPSEHDVQGLVLTPTRELCIQVTQALRSYATRKGVDIVAVFGGAPIRSQQAQLRAGGHIVVGTVGRVKDLISRHSLVLHRCRFIVLDEADEMLDLGFLEDVEKIMALTPGSRQTALFSATMPPEIRKLAERYLYEPVTVKVKAATLTVETVEQFKLEVKPADKPDALARVLESERPDQAIVFVRTKIRCDQLHRLLRDRGLNVRALHGDMSQGARDGVMISFKGGRVPILVATDVAARGLDISSVTHVINYDVPTSPDVYVHRIGRTGRVGRSGRALTFYEPRQQRDIEAIDDHTGHAMAPWSPGAHVKPAKVEAKPRRHQKPEPVVAAAAALAAESAGAGVGAGARAGGGAGAGTGGGAGAGAEAGTGVGAGAGAGAGSGAEAGAGAGAGRGRRRRAGAEAAADRTGADAGASADAGTGAGAGGGAGAEAGAGTGRGRRRRAGAEAGAGRAGAEAAAGRAGAETAAVAAAANGGASAKLVIAGGRVHGIEPKDLIRAITSATGLDGTAVRNVRVLDRFAFVDVPAGDADRVVAEVDGTRLDGHTLRLEPVRA